MPFVTTLKAIPNSLRYSLCGVLARAVVQILSFTKDQLALDASSTVNTATRY